MPHVIKKNGSRTCWIKASAQFTQEEVTCFIDNESLEVQISDKIHSEREDEFKQVGDDYDVDGQEALESRELLCPSSQTVIKLLQDGPPLDVAERNSIIFYTDDDKPTINQCHYASVGEAPRHT